MNFYVAILDSLDVYQNIFTSTNYTDCINYYDTQLANNFTDSYTLVPNINFNYLINRIYVNTMTIDQQNGIEVISAGCSQYCLLMTF